MSRISGLGRQFGQERLGIGLAGALTIGPVLAHLTYGTGSRDPIASRRFDDLVNEARIVIEPVTEAQARIAREAFRDFGRGSGHPAKLNFGDCFAYALAKTQREPLLFKGNDFTATDVLRVR